MATGTVTPASILSNAEALIQSVNADAAEAALRLESIAFNPFLRAIEFESDETISLSKAPSLVTDNDFPTLEKVPFDVSIGEFDPNAYKANVYESEFFTFLEPYLTQQITTGGPGISTEVQNALFNDQRENDLQTLADSLDSVRSNYGRTGFPLPTQVMRGQENEIIKKYDDIKANRSREITALLAERTSDFVKHAITTGSGMEETRMRFALGFSGLFNEITNSSINKFKAEQEARTTEFKGQIDLILSKLQIGKLNADLDLSFQTQLLKQWEIESTQAINKTVVLIKQAEQQTATQLEAAKSLATYYSALVASTASQLTGVASDSTTTSIAQE